MPAPTLEFQEAVIARLDRAIQYPPILQWLLYAPLEAEHDQGWNQPLESPAAGRPGIISRRGFAPLSSPPRAVSYKSRRQAARLPDL